MKERDLLGLRKGKGTIGDRMRRVKTMEEWNNGTRWRIGRIGQGRRSVGGKESEESEEKSGRVGREGRGK